MITRRQHQALDADTLGPADRARFWRVARHDGLDCLAAAFVDHRYAPHSHDTFVIGLIMQGCETFRLRGAERLASAGELCFVNPGEVHDGAPLDDGYAYRMTYPSESFIRAVVAETVGRGEGWTPRFPEHVARDGEAARLFVAAHRAFEQGFDPLAADAALLEAYGLLVERYGGVGRIARMDGREGGPVTRARAYLDDHAAKPVTLATLAAVAGLSARHLLRAFKREAGLSPHAYQTDARVRLARRMLRQGAAPAEVAADCGFCDQSHLNRAFKARLGVGPGAFRTATGGDRRANGDKAVSSKTSARRAA